MTPFGWICLGITAVIVIIYIILKIYVNRKIKQYDGLGGIIKRKKTSIVPLNPKNETDESRSQKHI